MLCSASFQKEKVYIGKLNMILVQVRFVWLLFLSTLEIHSHRFTNSSKCHITMICVYIWWLQWKCLLRFFQFVSCYLMFLCLDPEAGVAETLAHIYQRYCWSEPHQWEPLPEQYDHSQAPQWGGIWLLQWPDDTSESQTPEGQVRRH